MAKISIVNRDPGWEIRGATPKQGGEFYSRFRPGSYYSIKNAVSYCGGTQKDILWAIKEMINAGYIMLDIPPDVATKLPVAILKKAAGGSALALYTDIIDAKKAASKLGSITTPKSQKASRENGKSGGAPKKPVYWSDLDKPEYQDDFDKLENYRYPVVTAELTGHEGYTPDSIDGDLTAECPFCSVMDGYVSSGEHAEHGRDIVHCSACDKIFKIKW